MPGKRYKKTSFVTMLHFFLFFAFLPQHLIYYAWAKQFVQRCIAPVLKGYEFFGLAVNI